MPKFYFILLKVFLTDYNFKISKFQVLSHPYLIKCENLSLPQKVKHYIVASVCIIHSHYFFK